MFRIAMQSTDVVSKFMPLYQILLDICKKQGQGEANDIINNIYKK